jgi:lipoprotein LprG
VIRRRRSPLAALVAVLVPLPLALALTGCSSDDSGSGNSSPTQVLAGAKKQLDETKGVTIKLSTKALPKGVDGVLAATGIGTHQPGFDGSLKVLVNNVTVDVPVVGVGGKVYAKIPFTNSFSEVDPADYGAPDPAELMSPDTGLSSWLTATKDVKEGGQSRFGDQVLTTYTGTIPGSAVAQTIPSADGGADFAATYHIDSDGKLVDAEVRGPFYRNGVVDYTIALSGYGTEKTVTKP